MWNSRARRRCHDEGCDDLGILDEVRDRETVSDCTFTVDDEIALFVHKKCFASEGCEGPRCVDWRVRGGAAGGSLSGVDVVDRAVIEDAMIGGTPTGSPTIHVLNTTASAIESLTLS